MKKLLVILIALAGYVSAQQKTIDSLKTLIESSREDSVKVKSLIFYGEVIYSEMPDSAFNSFLIARKIAEENLAQPEIRKDKQASFIFSKYLADAFYDLGYLALAKGDVPSGLEYYHQSLKIRENTFSPTDNSRDRHGIAQTLNDIGLIYHKQENYPEAIKYYARSMAIRKDLNDKPGTAQSLNNIGVTYKNQNDIRKAFDNYQQALKIQEELNDREGLGYTLNNIAAIYKDYGDPECKGAKSDCERTGCEKALDYLLRSLKIQEGNDDKAGIAFSKNNIASVLYKLGRHQDALVYGKQSLELARELGFPDIISRASQTLSKLYAQAGDYKNAFEMHLLYKQMADSISNENNRKSSIRRDFQYVYDKKLAADSIRAMEERKTFEVKMKQEKTQRMALYLGISLIAVFTGFIYNRFRVTQRQKNVIALQKLEVEKQKTFVEKQNKVIEEKNKDITDSITYAKRIQQAKLPQIEDIYKALPDSFVLFKPKDIVSGDFYFFHQKGNVVYIAAADCTGHGVPGALMSMICSEQLNDAVKNHSDTSTILEFVNRGLKASLRQSDQEGSSRDGMDIALCAIDIESRVIRFSGANRPLWVVKKDEAEIIELKSTKKAIGGFTEDEQRYATQEIVLGEGDSFYISTDGYADSFNPDGKKLTTKKFKQLILGNSAMPMKEIGITLDKFISNYVGETEQVDDILVIGVRV